MALNKLVRDKIPDLIAAGGEHPITRILSDAEYRICLEQKLDEETSEYHESKSLEELADILEVVYALCKAQGYTTDELNDIYRKKHNERGGFEKKIFLLGKE